MRVLVTGGGGFLGGWVTKSLSAIDGVEVIAPSSKECNLLQNSDLDNFLKNIEIVVHLAAITGAENFHRENPERIYAKNIAMARNLFNSARSAGVKKVVAAGSIMEYADNAPLPLREEFLDFGTPTKSHLAYGKAKREMRKMGQSIFSTPATYVHLVFTNLFGPGQNPAAAFIPSAILKVANAIKNNDLKIEMWGSGSASRDFLYVQDAAQAVVKAVQGGAMISGPYNICSGVNRTIKESMLEIVNLMKYKGTISWDITKPEGSPGRTIDGTRAKKMLNFYPEDKFTEHLQACIDWYTSQHD